MTDPGFPFFTIETFHLGPLPLQPFGLMLAFGVVFGSYLGRLRAERLDLDVEELRRSLLWVIGLGFVGAHVFDTLFYRPGDLVDDPLLLFKFWAGISSYGGFLGGAFGFWLFFFKIYPTRDMRKYADTYVWGLSVGFTFGRLGCTIVHDHIGAKSEDFAFATYYPIEAARRHGIEPGLHHNLGMYEFVYMVFICLVLFALDRGGRSRRNGRSKLPAGSLVLITGMLYAPIRFFLDYLRVNASADPRYLSLTFAQWVSIATVVACVIGLVVLFRTAGAEPTTDDEGADDKPDKPAANKSDAGKPAAAKPAVTKPPGKGKGKGNKKKRRKAN